MENKVIYRVIKCHKTGKYYPERKYTSERKGAIERENFFEHVPYYGSSTYKTVVCFDTAKEAEEYLLEQKKKDFPYDVVRCGV